MTTILDPSSPEIAFPDNPAPPTLAAFFPPGHFTLILGYPGTAKSLLALDLAARVSRGEFLHSPDPQDPPASAFVASREDDPHTIQCRLRAAGADLSRTHILQHASLIPDDPADLGYDSPLHKALFDHLDRNPRLLILDPLPAFLESHDSTHPRHIRKILRPFLTMAMECNVTVIGINHLNKNHRLKNPLDRAAGSQAYPALARSVLLLTPYPYHYPHPHPNGGSSFPTSSSELPDPSRRRLLLPLKNNFAPTNHALSFTLHSSTPPIHADPHLPPAACIQWDQTPIPHHPLLNSSHTPPATDPFQQSQLDLACQFLQTSLQNGPVPSGLILQQARHLALAPATLSRARLHLHIQVTHHGPTNEWRMSLPPAPAQ